MRRAVVHDPEHALGVAIRRLRHDLGNQAIERFDAGGLLATAEELRAMNIHRGQVTCPEVAAALGYQAVDPLAALRA